MKIALVSKFGHMECLGFLLEVMKSFEVTIYMSERTDQYEWTDYFSKLYSFCLIKHLDIDVSQYDKVFKITSNDECLEKDKNAISILHLQSLSNLNNNSRRFVSLTPYIDGSNIYYMFPIFRPFPKIYTEKMVAFIGFYTNENIDADTDQFIDANPDYRFVFITTGEPYFNYSNLYKHRNVIHLPNLKTEEMIRIINESKYVLSRKYINYDRFSGQLGLAMSFEKPLIIDSKTAAAYKLPGIQFQTNYSEIGALDEIKDDQYDKIVDQIRSFNEDHLEKNTKTIHKLLSKNTVLLVEPRILPEIPQIIGEYYAHLSDWNFVFYCGKGTKEIWEKVLDKYVELRELDTTNFTPSEYSYFLKQKSTWDSIEGEYVLTIQSDTRVANVEPYTIDYFMKLDKSYIGGNMNFRWNELARENLEYVHYNFNGGLSLRKREDMIRIIESFPPILFDDRTAFSQTFETDPEDVYFTIGCQKLGLPMGNDEESSCFAIHKIYKDAYFGIHNPSPTVIDEFAKRNVFMDERCRPGNKKDFTIILQGVIYTEELLIKIIDECADLAEIIVSSYFANNMDFLCRLKTAYPNIIFINNDLAEFENWLMATNNFCTVEHPQQSYFNNYFYQIKTVEAAFKFVKTKYVVKSRADFYFSGMKDFMKEIVERDNIVTCFSTYVRGYAVGKTFKYHPPDICYGGRSDIIKNVSDYEIAVFKLQPACSEDRKWRGYIDDRLNVMGLHEHDIFVNADAFSDFMSSIFNIYPINKEGNTYQLKHETHIYDTVKSSKDYFIHGCG